MVSNIALSCLHTAKLLNCFIRSIDEILKNTTTPGQSGTENNGNDTPYFPTPKLEPHHQTLNYIL